MTATVTPRKLFWSSGPFVRGTYAFGAAVRYTIVQVSHSELELTYRDKHDYYAKPTVVGRFTSMVAAKARAVELEADQ